MKFLFVALSVILVGSNAATTKTPEGRFIDGIIVGMIEDVSQQIKDQGLDPLGVDSESIEYRFPVTDLMLVQGAIENLLVEGLSNIVINSIDFSILATRLRFDIVLPSIAATLDTASVNGRFASLEGDAEISGSLEIRAVRVVGEVRVSIGISGIGIRDASINFTLGGIDSDLKVLALGKDFSEIFNNILGNVIPDFVVNYSSEINAILEYFLIDILEGIL